MKIDVITLFPDIFRGFTEEALIKQAKKRKVLELNLINLRDYASDRHRTCDDAPYGGGAGMVLKCEPLFKAIKAASTRDSKVILLSPQGKTFNQKMAGELAKKKHLVFICGRYEGVDERVRETLVDEEISIGDFVTAGGELPAMLMIEATVRLVKGAIGKKESYERDSFYEGLLDWPHFTRPAVYKKMKVPAVLLGGDHALIQEWRQQQSEKITKSKRPDLWALHRKINKKRSGK